MSQPPRLDETPSRRGWQIGLFLEHLAEAASLWEQRPADRLNPDLAWTDLGDEQDRLEAHLDALVLGGDLALAVCRQQALDGDPGELHAALRVFCRHGRSDLVGIAMEAVDPDDGEALDAMSEALVAELPAAWEVGALRPDLLDDPRRLRLAADLITSRGLGAGVLLDRLMDAPDGMRARLVRTLGRSADGTTLVALRPLLGDPAPSVRLEAAVALLRGGAPDAAATVLGAARTDSALLPAFALAGTSAAIPWLHAVLAHPPTAPAAADVLGLMGDPSSVPPLIEAVEAGVEGAPWALALITGAPFTEETTIEDIFDDDELFDDERARREAGEPTGAPVFTTTVEGPSTDPERWRAWWAEHADAFAEADRWRQGLPAGPASQVASLAAPFAPHRLRRWIADELAARYRLPLPFDPEADVARQQAALAALTAWAEGTPFVPGRWYVGGHYVG
ncbi:HEAT repeat domain-containing protein [Rubrivirga sp. IMCC43871]|uniref:HEAT repeat domain-containing protein n=1 Tax=Rubrivirga sp. IMCC43871 TaxID=3391575 RepID=UPI00398FD754